MGRNSITSKEFREKFVCTPISLKKNFSEKASTEQSKSSIKKRKSTPQLKGLRSSKRKITQIIEECSSIQENLLDNWEKARDTFKSRTKSYAALEKELGLKKFNYWTISKDYLNGKKQLEERYKKLNEQQIAKELTTVKSILGHHKNFSTGNLEGIYIGRQDLKNTKTAKLLNANKREFGRPFSKQEVSLPKNYQGKRKKARNLGICPEETILKDIKTMQKQDSMKKQPSLEESEIKPKERVNPSALSTRNQFIYKELKKVQPSKSEELNEKKRLLLEIKLGRIDVGKEIEKEVQKFIRKRNSKTAQHSRNRKFNRVRIGEMPFTFNYPISEEDQEIAQEINSHREDVDTASKINQIFTTAQHEHLLKKEF